MIQARNTIASAVMISMRVRILGTEIGEILGVFKCVCFCLGKSDKLTARETDLVRIEIEKHFVVRAVSVLALVVVTDVDSGHFKHSINVSDPDVCDFGVVHSSVVRDQCLRAAFGSQAK